MHNKSERRRWGMSKRDANTAEHRRYYEVKVPNVRTVSRQHVGMIVQSRNQKSRRMKLTFAG